MEKFLLLWLPLLIHELQSGENQPFDRQDLQKNNENSEQNQR